MENFQDGQQLRAGTALKKSGLFVNLSMDKPISELRSGDLCPVCHVGRLDYDGLLNLSCSGCGYSIGGCFT